MQIIDTSPKTPLLDLAIIEKAFDAKPSVSSRGFDLFGVRYAMSELLRRAAEKLAASRQKDEIKFLVCKKCGCVIDCGMCSYNCPDDSKHTDERRVEDMEYRIFSFARTEQYVHEPDSETVGE